MAYRPEFISAVEEEQRATIARLTAELEAARAEEASWRMASQEAEHEVAAVRAQRDAAEAKLAKAVEVLRGLSDEERIDHVNGGVCFTDGAKIARAIIAELTGGKDE